MLYTLLFTVFLQTDVYIKTLNKMAKEPLQFVSEKLIEYDLLIFDDALHSAAEPWDFYNQLIETDGDQIDLVFIEVLSVDAQSAIDRYTQEKDSKKEILAPAFQDTFNGMGFTYQTVLDFLTSVKSYNQNHQKKIRVIAVDVPVFWAGLKNKTDYENFQKTLSSRDYFIYQQILSGMDGFKSGKKGFFLTNSRHAYKQIVDPDGKPFWNIGTFFYNWHRGHSYSIKFHNVNMNISQEKQNGEDTVEGLGRYEYSWIRIDNGNWDKAFNQFGKPLAFELGQTVFGKTPYIGNHMHKAMAGQTMSDAFDAVIYIKPLEKTQFSASFDFIYTTEFKNELKRRLAVIHGDGLDAFLKQRNVTLDDYIDQLAKPSGRPRNPLIPAAE